MIVKWSAEDLLYNLWNENEDKLNTFEYSSVIEYFHSHAPHLHVAAKLEVIGFALAVLAEKVGLAVADAALVRAVVVAQRGTLLITLKNKYMKYVCGPKISNLRINY